MGTPDRHWHRYILLPGAVEVIDLIAEDDQDERGH
jgi:hypothetical protein